MVISPIHTLAKTIENINGIKITEEEYNNFSKMNI